MWRNMFICAEGGSCVTVWDAQEVLINAQAARQAEEVGGTRSSLRERDGHRVRLLKPAIFNMIFKVFLTVTVNSRTAVHFKNHEESTSHATSCTAGLQRAHALLSRYRYPYGHTGCGAPGCARGNYSYVDIAISIVAIIAISIVALASMLSIRRDLPPQSPLIFVYY